MKKWIKRLTVFGVGLVLVLGLALAGLYVFGVKRAPAWLQRPTFSAAEQAAAASRLDQKIIETLSKVQEMDAYDPANTQPTAGDLRPVSTQPIRELKVSFTEQELNASFAKWDKLYGWTERYKDHVKDASVVLHDGRIVFAGASEEFGSIVSLHFEPKLDDDGQLSLRLSNIQAGRLPLPQAVFDKKRADLRTRLQTALPGLQRRAEFRKDGSANTEAMSAAMAKLVLNVLADEPGEPVVFLPVQNQRSIPVRLTGVKVVDKTLALTVKPLNSSERVALLERIRERYEKETALNPTNSPTPAPRRRS